MKQFNIINNIGNAIWLYWFTNFIYKYCEILNNASEIHDILYEILYYNINWINRIVLKILFDLIFLLFGVFRALLVLRVWEIVPIMLSYLILLISTIYPPLWFDFEKYKNGV